jgi:membrane protein implicated in regulation of membrane protease activity
MPLARRLGNPGRRTWIYFTIGISIFFAVVLLVNWSWIWSGLTKLNLGTILFLGKSAWDWLALLFVPVVIGLLGWVTQRLVKSQEELRRVQEKTLADERNRQEVLKDYLDQMTGLLTSGKDSIPWENEVYYSCKNDSSSKRT